MGRCRPMLQLCADFRGVSFPHRKAVNLWFARSEERRWLLKYKVRNLLNLCFRRLLEFTRRICLCWVRPYDRLSAIHSDPIGHFGQCGKGATMMDCFERSGHLIFARYFDPRWPRIGRWTKVVELSGLFCKWLINTVLAKCRWLSKNWRKQKQERICVPGDN